MRNRKTPPSAVFEAPRPKAKAEASSGDRLLYLDDLVAKLGVCEATIRRWRKRGKFPEGRYLSQPGRAPHVWSERVIDAWVENKPKKA